MMVLYKCNNCGYTQRLPSDTTPFGCPSCAGGKLIKTSVRESIMTGAQQALEHAKKANEN